MPIATDAALSARPLSLRRLPRYACLFVVLAVVLAGCDIFKTDPAVIDGTVLNAQTERAIAGARVEILNRQGTRTIQETTTDEAGAFSFTVDVDSLQTFRIVASKEGFDQAQVTLDVEAEERISLRDPLRLAPAGGGNQTTGEARSVTLARRTAQAIGVSGSGSVETSTLTFAVLDGNGVPLDAASNVEVRFRLLNQPSPSGAPEAEFIYPETAQTDENGEAKVTLTSGIRSGVAQIQAEVTGPQGMIRSTPVVIAIHGGLPSQEHFTVAPLKLNFHGRSVYGITNTISVIAGDEYGNPVQPQTEVYFTTNHGVVEGSGATNNQGRTSVELIAAEPLPPNGIGTVTARTAGRNGSTVQASTQVLFSGPTRIDLHYLGGSPSAGHNFRLVIHDDLGHPIVGGSSATVTAVGENLRAVGQTSISIPDAGGPGPGITEFQFAVRAEGEEPMVLDEIKIDVTSPNGNRSRTCFGTACFNQAGRVHLVDPTE